MSAVEVATLSRWVTSLAAAISTSLLREARLASTAAGFSSRKVPGEGTPRGKLRGFRELRGQSLNGVGMEPEDGPKAPQL